MKVDYYIYLDRKLLTPNFSCLVYCWRHKMITHWLSWFWKLVATWTEKLIRMQLQRLCNTQHKNDFQIFEPSVIVVLFKHALSSFSSNSDLKLYHNYSWFLYYGQTYHIRKFKNYFLPVMPINFGVGWENTKHINVLRECWSQQVWIRKIKFWSSTLHNEHVIIFSNKTDFWR